MTYDRVLLESGWSGEYKGKFHSPYQYTRDEHDKTYYSQPVQWMNGKGPSNPPKGIQGLSDTYHSYLDLHEPLQQLLPGQLLDGSYRRPYWADVADLRYEQAFNKSPRQNPHDPSSLNTGPGISGNQERSSPSAGLWTWNSKIPGYVYI